MTYPSNISVARLQVRTGKLEPVNLTQNQLRSIDGELAETSRVVAELGSLTLHETTNNMAALASELRALQPHVVVLCCSAESPQALLDAANEWLPALEAADAYRPSGWPYLPVVLALTKFDLFAEGEWTSCLTREWKRHGTQHLPTHHVCQLNP